MDIGAQQEVFDLFQRGVLLGDVTSMGYIGLFYAYGFGVMPDYAKAREWYELAADKGDAIAMGNLGGLYSNGFGVARDYAKAREWFEKAANKGDAFAMSNLSMLYEDGFGVARDYAKAREWFEKAADKGDGWAVTVLENLPIREASRAGRHAEALQLLEALTAKVKAAETKRDGKPGKETARALREVAWRALFAQEFRKALAVADRVHALLPDDLGNETNRAHAICLWGNTKNNLRRSTCSTKASPSRMVNYGSACRISYGSASSLRTSWNSARRACRTR